MKNRKTNISEVNSDRHYVYLLLNNGTLNQGTKARRTRQNRPEYELIRAIFSRRITSEVHLKYTQEFACRIIVLAPSGTETTQDVSSTRQTNDAPRSPGKKELFFI